jgi:hypothetical protein
LADDVFPAFDVVGISPVDKYLNRRGELLFAQSGRMQCAPTPKQASQGKDIT